MHTWSSDSDAELLFALQGGLPLCARPFAAMATRLGMAEADVVACAEELLRSGFARRLGGIFDSRRLGYSSTLCAADVPECDLAPIVAQLAPHSGITHCYQREGPPNLWFTVTAPAGRLDAKLAELAGVLRPWELASLPARRTFKIEVVLDVRARDGGPAARTLGGDWTGEAPLKTDAAPAEHAAAAGDVGARLTERERAVVRRLQASIPIMPEPFGAMARDLGYTPEQLLDLLSEWRDAGVLRRIALILRHRALGFAANGMCVWSVGAERIEAAGRALAGCAEVSHCYERAPHRLFPFDLFAMVHAGSREAAQRMRARVADAAGLAGGRMLLSVQEFKKSSPALFQEGGAE